ncbi:MAG TPA: DNA-directed RNA polymerase subunit epsilon [Bacillota bacterium]|nr:DNA-directed RNA polymerase subunit epsilon [Bacillota bacterium]
MVFKVLYQELPDEAPVRERTKSLYIKAESERDARRIMADYNYNIEYIQQLDGAHLTYEQQSDNFTLENA